MADVSLIQSSIFHPDVEKAPPLGVLYLASNLRAAGIDPVVYDMKGYDLTVPRVVDAYRKNPTPYVGIGAITYDSRAMHELANGIRAANKNARIVAGGPHATAYREDLLLQNRDLDAVILNEGEETFADLIHGERSGKQMHEIPGLAFRDGDTVMFSPERPLLQDLDALEYPAYDLVPPSVYWDKPRIAWVYAEKQYATITTSRGCPYRCAYCHRTLGKRWRVRSLDNVMGELHMLKERYGVREIVPVDDMFNLSVKRVNEFAQRVIDEKLDLKFHFPVGFRADILTEESIALLKEAGMYRCMVAIETGSPRVQKVIDRNLNIDKTRHMIGKIADAGVMVHGVFILGLPTETKEDMMETMRFALESKLHSLAVSIAIPFKDCKLIDLAKADGVEFSDDFDRYNYTQSRVNLTHVPTEWVIKLRRDTYRRFFTPRRVWNFVRLLPRPTRHMARLAKVFVRKAFLW
ncbi:B12-binding domain-containing radical SAM protein [bacterium]|nr:B12-binding domain-containing radical SAM protein [bacterium]